MRYDATANAIEATGLVKRFGKTTALDGVDLAARQGRVLGVLGPNGAGKTTAVRILATLLRPDSGQVSVCGYDVLRDAHQVRQLIGLTGQYASVDEGLSGTNNLIMIGRLLGMPRAEVRARARELLARFELTEAAARPAKTYSGGMRRRLEGTPDQLKAKTGGQVLQVAPADPARKAEVTALMTELIRGQVGTDAENGVAIAQVGDSALVRHVFRELDDRGIELAEFALRKPSMDEVFFTLTGRRASDEDSGTRELEGSTR
jgi:ABC-type uncharacterized transport system ATPase subunit